MFRLIHTVCKPAVSDTFVGLLALLLVACGGGSDASPSDPTDTTQPPGPDTTQPPGPDTTQPPGPDGTQPPSPDTTDPPVVTGDPGSIVHSLVIELDETKGADLDGDGAPDNAMGGMFTNIATLTGSADVNVAMATAIDDGLLSIGMVWPGVAAADPGALLESAGFSMYVVNLNDTDGNPATKDAYTVDPSSYQDGTNIPKTLFPGATITNGTLAAGPSSFNLGFPYYDVHMQVLMGKASVTGTVTQDTTGIALTNGQLTGAVSSRSFVDWINMFVLSEWCTCATGLNNQLLDPEAGLVKEACNADADGSACTGDDQTLCGFFVNQCTLLMPIMGAFADIDTDADGVPDSFSALMHLQGQGTLIQGLPQ